ncbi:2-hydroxyacid dehydrogenase [Ensifer soli]|uniref:2-hydroxyacid dehydrogenase n=1 Tax=Ciceribacter sp. sgz301302 TaxID=3342379 RepID=UPI0035BB11A2
MTDARPPILLLGPISPRVGERLAAAGFPTVRASTADPALLPAEAASVRGVAVHGAAPARLMQALPQLEIVASFGVGYDAVDAGHAAKSGIVVTHTPDVLNEEVADTAIALLLNTLRELPQAETWLRAGRWAKEGPYRLSPLTLRGRTVGLYGLGRIGMAIARRLEAFGVGIEYHTRSVRAGVPWRHHPTLLSLARSVDTLVVIVPGTAETRHSVDAEVLEALGATGVLVNVGRGSTVDEAALIDALSRGVIAGAGLDVFDDEPRVPEALIALPNVSLLPHVGSASVATRAAMADLVADNLVAWFDRGHALTPVPETPFARKAAG